MTKRQLELLTFIKEYVATYGYSPSFDEMKQVVGGNSKSAVFRTLNNLQEQGYIKRLPHRVRAIEVVENPTMPSNLSNFSVYDMACEAKRRGLVLGHLLRDETGKRTFKEIVPQT